MPWFAVRPRDPADPRWPMPGKPGVTVKAEDEAEAREKFAQAYLSRPFGTPETPVPEVGLTSFRGDPEALVVEETEEPSPPDA